MRGKINPFTSSEFVLLGLINEKPTHGYDLHKMITDPDAIGMIWNVKMSNLYAQLEKLAQKGFISGVLQAGHTHPNRTEYKITPKGQEVFQDWVKSVVQHPRDFRQEFMARFFFLLKFAPGSIKDFFSRQSLECQVWLENTHKSMREADNDSLFSNAVMEFRVSQIEAITRWLEKVQTKYLENIDLSTNTINTIEVGK